MPSYILRGFLEKTPVDAYRPKVLSKVIHLDRFGGLDLSSSNAPLRETEMRMLKPLLPF